ncbi:hypothetical protein ACG83_39975 [Frankia sp. R43]|nr:hypothetical protein ACG83_39975 [Frankia sp. R43]
MPPHPALRAAAATERDLRIVVVGTTTILNASDGGPRAVLTAGRQTATPAKAGLGVTLVYLNGYHK